MPKNDCFLSTILDCLGDPTIGAPKSQRQSVSKSQKLQEAKHLRIRLPTARAVAMSDVDDADVPETPDSSLASTRSRRGPSKKTNSRFEALKKLKAAKARDWSYEVRLFIIINHLPRLCNLLCR